MARSRNVDFPVYGFLFAILVLALFPGCSEPLPRLDGYLGTYRIIKIEEKGESIKTPVLNNIELTAQHYIYRIDRNGDNRFNSDEIITIPLDFELDSENNPFLVLSDGARRIGLLSHDYYDLLLREGASPETETTLFARKVIPSREDMAFVLEKKKLSGEYEIIKFRENETILNIANLGRIQIDETLYISEFDENRDFRIEKEERMVSPYEFQREDSGESYLLINRDNIKVFPYKEENFDLLLRRIDNDGNDVIMYLKRR